MAVASERHVFVERAVLFIYLFYFFVLRRTGKNNLREYVDPPWSSYCGSRPCLVSPQ